MYLFNNYTVLSAEPGKCSKMPSVFERSRKGRLVSKLNNHGKKLGLSIFITGLKSHIWSFMFKYTPFKINKNKNKMLFVIYAFLYEIISKDINSHK